MPAGTAAKLVVTLDRLAPVGDAAELAWNPEFLREGTAIRDTLNPGRIVAGVQSARAEQLLRTIYATPLAAGSQFFVTDLATAELAKVAANSFLATKISFINIISEVCDVMGGDVMVLAEILGSDPRIGEAFLRPGIGFGGGCLPKDIRAFSATLGELGLDQARSLLDEVDSINLRCRARMIELARDMTGGRWKEGG